VFIISSKKTQNPTLLIGKWGKRVGNMNYNQLFTLYNRHLKFILALLFSLLLTGCRFIGNKNLNISVIYAITTLSSFIIFFIYHKLSIKKRFWFKILLFSIFIVNLGYFGLSISKTLETALWANRISYLGSVFLPLSMFMCILNITDLPYKPWLPKLLISIAIFIFFIAASPGYLDIYYSHVTLYFINGATVLQKVYGPLHCIYLYYLFAYFFCMIYLLIIVKKKKRVTSYNESLTLFLAVFVNILIWLFEQIVQLDFEILSISYSVSTLFLLVLDNMMQENERQIKKYQKQVSYYQKVSKDSKQETLSSFTLSLIYQLALKPNRIFYRFRILSTYYWYLFYYTE